MCGRFTLLANQKQIEKEFDLDSSIAQYEASYNVAPGQNILAVINDGKSKRAGYLKWGLVPSWANDAKIGYKMINARSESAHEKPSFKKLMMQKRCLIIADSFYEWQQTEESKQPKRIQLKDRNLFAFAGLWDKWQQGDEVLFTCTILTKESNEFMQPIHHRMPIILPKEKQDEWIKPQIMRPENAQQFIADLDMDDMKAYNVKTHVNSARNNDETCIAPLI